MPLYEYKCSQCDTKFEKLESFAAESTSDCPVCGSKAGRMLSLGSFILKGKGWYASEHSSRPREENKPVSCDAKCDSCCLANQKSDGSNS